MIYLTINSSKLYTKNQKTVTENGVSHYSCSTDCTPGTTKTERQTAVVSCCSTNNCNTGNAAPDSNKLWCNFRIPLIEQLAVSGTQSCPTTCMVRKNKLLMG
jgi:hypothetical protein